MAVLGLWSVVAHPSLGALAACLQALPPTWPMRHKRNACRALQATARLEPGCSSALDAPSPRKQQLHSLGDPARAAAALPEPPPAPKTQLRGQEAASSLRGCEDGAQPVARAGPEAAPPRQRRLHEAAGSVVVVSEQAWRNTRKSIWSEADACACRDVLRRALGRRDLRTALQAADAAHTAGVALTPGQADALLQGCALCPSPFPAPFTPAVAAAACHRCRCSSCDIVPKSFSLYMPRQHAGCSPHSGKCWPVLKHQKRAGLCSAGWHGAAWRMYKAACQRGVALRYATYQTLIRYAFQARSCARAILHSWQAVGHKGHACGVGAGCASRVGLCA